MKKITRANFEGLRQRYPVLNKEEMRRYVGGNSTTLYDESDLALLNVYTLDIDMDACSAVGSDKDDEMEEDVWTSDLGISVFSAGGGYGGTDGGYGYGGIDGDYGGTSSDYYNDAFNDWLAGGNSFYDEYGNFFWSTDNYFTDPYGNSFYYGGDEGPQVLPKYKGVIDAIVGNNDCFFLCVGQLLGESSVAIGNEYGDYLKEKGYSLDKINEILRQGMSSTHFEDFMENGLNAQVTKMDSHSFQATINQSGTAPKGMGLVYIGKTVDGKDQYHAIVVRGSKQEDGRTVLEYTDPQSSDPSKIYTSSDIKKFYKIE